MREKTRFFTEWVAVWVAVRVYALRFLGVGRSGGQAPGGQVSVPQGSQAHFHGRW